MTLREERRHDRNEPTRWNVRDARSDEVRADMVSSLRAGNGSAPGCRDATSSSTHLITWTNSRWQPASCSSPWFMSRMLINFLQRLGAASNKASVSCGRTYVSSAPCVNSSGTSSAAWACSSLESAGARRVSSSLSVHAWEGPRSSADYRRTQLVELVGIVCGEGRRRAEPVIVESRVQGRVVAICSSTRVPKDSGSCATVHAACSLAIVVTDLPGQSATTTRGTQHARHPSALTMTTDGLASGGIM